MAETDFKVTLKLAVRRMLLPQFAATLQAKKKALFLIAQFKDVKFMAEILSELGAAVNQIDYDTWEIDPANIKHIAPYELVRKMRASVCLLGPLVGRLKKLKFQCLVAVYRSKTH